MLSYLMVKQMDVGLEVILVILLFCHMRLVQSDDLVVEGSIVMDDPPDPCRRGDNVTFSFNVTFNVTDDLDTLNVTIWSRTLQFRELTTQWTLTGMDNATATGSELKLDSMSDHVVDERVDGDGFYCLHLMNISTNRWRFEGNFTVTVKDDVGPGRRIQTFLNMSVPLLGGNSTCISVLPSFYVYTPPLRADLNPLPSIFIGIRETASVNVSLTLTDDNTAPLVEIISVFENTSREVMLTVNNVRINDTYGFEADVVDEISRTEPELISTLMTYQRDIGSVQLPVLMNAVGANESGLTMGFQLRLEDYTAMADGDELKVGAGVKFGDGVIWVSDVNFTVNAPGALSRRPDLELGTSASSVCTGEDRNDVDLVLDIHHSQSSNATAYDLQLNVFPLPSMTLLSVSTTPPQDYPFVFNTTQYIRITLGRLTFSDPALLWLKMRIQMNESYIRDASDFVVAVELIYNDRWNNSLDRATPLKHIELKLNKKCAERFTWTTATTCQCGFNGSRNDCGCCIDYKLFNMTQCGMDNPGMCAPTHKPWLCWRKHGGFLARSRLSGFNGEVYECDASQKYSRQRNSVTSCYKKSSDGYREVHPMVSVILGKDSSSNNLYGISSTGHAYVISKDAGQSWCTIRDTDILTATSAATYSSADLY